MPEYTFRITDHVKVESKVTLRAISLDEAITIAHGLAHQEMSKYGRLLNFSTSDLVEGIIDTQLHIDP